MVYELQSRAFKDDETMPVMFYEKCRQHLATYPDSFIFQRI